MKNGRKAFIDTLIELAEKDDKVILITMDVGFSFIEKFKDKFPKRYFNFGVTEQSSMLIAAALALDGWKPYVYSMINFVVFRPYEMVRNGICHHNANVKLIGVQGSEKYKFLGFSHNIYGNEDINALQYLPNITLYLPETEANVSEAMKDAYSKESPCYMRI